MENPKHPPIGKVHNKIHNMDLNEVNSRTSYNRNHNEKSISKSDQNEQNEPNNPELNDNKSEKANSVHTSYQYRKNKNGQNSTYSKGSSNHSHHNHQNEEQLSVSISDNDNLICPDCINTVLIEEKQKRDDNDRNYYNSDGLFQDGNRNYERKIIEDKKRQREYNTNEAIQNLAKINAGLSSKDKLIQMNENSRNPLNDGLPDYQYQKFKDNYERRQKMINDNINKFYPKSGDERPEIASYYDNYVYNPNYNKDKNKSNRDYNNRNYTNNMKDNYGPKDVNRQEYIKSLEDQINQKNEMKRREKEEDRRRAQQQYEEMRKEMKKEEEEKYLREQKLRDEMIKANKDLIDQKNRMKMKELEEKLKYRDYYDRKNEEYQKELKNKELENQRRKNDIYNDNKNEYENRKRMKEQENRKYYNTDNNNYNDNNEQQNQNKKNEKMGRCCRCHRVFPRRLLTINRYFYKENRK